ncbi:minor tail protein [Mycobacterium phage CELFI]|uniref:Minor tail protein n=1 Tax=Mycobacterium phage CELFI TaxID=2769359 RepID=A0A7G9V442_9CAUD|nr:minor tail protein [Mycobacterium phage CELFI]QNO01048.1 minor tail protein [Mycobacterium phage CELFI]
MGDSGQLSRMGVYVPDKGTAAVPDNVRQKPSVKKPVLSESAQFREQIVEATLKRARAEKGGLSVT